MIQTNTIPPSSVPFSQPSALRELAYTHTLPPHSSTSSVAHSTLLPYVDVLVAALFRLLEPQVGNDGQVERYVQEQAVTTLAMVADASEGAFAAHYDAIMPLLMNVLRNAGGDVGEHRKLRWKAMECAGLIGL